MTNRWKIAKISAIRHLTLKLPGIRRVVDAAILDTFVRGGRVHTGGDERDRREIHLRDRVRQHPRLAVTYQSGCVRDLKPKLLRIYPQIRRIQSPPRPIDIYRKHFPDAVVYGQPTGTTKGRFDRRLPPRFEYRWSYGSNRLFLQALPN